MTVQTISKTTFDQLVSKTRLGNASRKSLTIQACELVMCDGFTAKDAALKVGVTKPTVSSALKRLNKILNDVQIDRVAVTFYVPADKQQSVQQAVQQALRAV